MSYSKIIIFAGIAMLLRVSLTYPIAKLGFLIQTSEYLGNWAYLILTFIGFFVPFTIIAIMDHAHRRKYPVTEYGYKGGDLGVLAIASSMPLAGVLTLSWFFITSREIVHSIRLWLSSGQAIEIGISIVITVGISALSIWLRRIGVFR